MPREQRLKIPISRDWVLNRIREGKDVRLKNALIQSNLDFRILELPTEHIDRTDLEKDAYNLSEDTKIVTSKILITSSKIEGEVNFSNIIFKGRVDFSNTEFLAHANFAGTQFFGHANFTSVFFEGNDFVPVSANFTGAKFNGNAAYFIVLSKTIYNLYLAKTSLSMPYHSSVR